MDLKYDFVPDLTGDDAHAHQLRRVPHGSRVLELGCATGYIARWLVEQAGCRVTGVDVIPEYVERAATFCERALKLDLNQVQLIDHFDAETFDIILAGDILEHLMEPLALLRQLPTLLSPGGRVIATIPNVAHADVRLALSVGRFDYRRLGLLDETHLRFFTRDTALKLFADAGLVVRELGRIRKPVFGTELGLTASDFPDAVVRWVSADPEATTYQFVVEAGLDGPAYAQRCEADSRAEILSELNHVEERLASSERSREATALQLATALGEFRELEKRYLAMRRASIINPLVVLPALWRRFKKRGET